MTFHIVALAGCKEKLPSTPTIVTGKIVDENNQPMSGIIFELYGIDQTGILKQRETFNIKSESDKDGKYEVSVLIPNTTNWVTFRISPMNTLRIFNNYQTFYLNGLIYEPFQDKVEIQREKYGKTTTINFQLRKI